MLHIHNTFHIPDLGRNRTIRVLLPKNYDKEKSRRYPVLYLQDGQNLFEAKTAAFRHWKLAEQLKRQPLNRQAILVGIDHGGIDRIHEYAPYKRGHNGGQAKVYLNFIAQQIKPFVDQHYRTWPHREATGIAGASMGGLLALYAGLDFPHVFGKVGALSPSIWFNPRILDLAKAGNALKSQFYISASKTEMRSMASTIEKTYWTFKQGAYADADLRVVLRDRGAHGEAFWSREFKPMFEWLFPLTAF